MTNVADTAPASGQTEQPVGSGAGGGLAGVRRAFAATEVDLRIFGMLVALVVILVGCGRRTW